MTSPSTILEDRPTVSNEKVRKVLDNILNGRMVTNLSDRDQRTVVVSNLDFYLAGQQSFVQAIDRISQALNVPTPTFANPLTQPKEQTMTFPSHNGSPVNKEEKNRLIDKLVKEQGTMLLDFKTAQQFADNVVYQHLRNNTPWNNAVIQYRSLCKQEKDKRQKKPGTTVAETNGYNNGNGNGAKHYDTPIEQPARTTTPFAPRAAAPAAPAAKPTEDNTLIIADLLAKTLPDGDIYTLTSSKGDVITLQNTSKDIAMDDEEYTPEENKAINRIVKQVGEAMAADSNLTEDQALAQVMKPLLEEASVTQKEEIEHALYILKRSLRAHSGIAGSSVADDSLIGQALRKAAEGIVTGTYENNTAALDAAMEPILGKKGNPVPEQETEQEAEQAR